MLSAQIDNQAIDNKSNTILIAQNAQTILIAGRGKVFPFKDKKTTYLVVADPQA